MNLSKSDRYDHRYSDKQLERQINREEYQSQVDRLAADKPEPSKALPHVTRRWR